jgi:hypothetical protein
VVNGVLTKAKDDDGESLSAIATIYFNKKKIQESNGLVSLGCSPKSYAFTV